MIKKKVSKLLSSLVYRLCLKGVERLAVRFEDQDPKVREALVEYRFRKRLSKCDRQIERHRKPHC